MDKNEVIEEIIRNKYVGKEVDIEDVRDMLLECWDSAYEEGYEKGDSDGYERCREKADDLLSNL